MLKFYCCCCEIVPYRQTKMALRMVALCTVMVRSFMNQTLTGSTLKEGSNLLTLWKPWLGPWWWSSLLLSPFLLKFYCCCREIAPYRRTKTALRMVAPVFFYSLARRSRFAPLFQTLLLYRVRWSSFRLLKCNLTAAMEFLILLLETKWCLTKNTTSYCCLFVVVFLIIWSWKVIILYEGAGVF